MAAPRKIFRIEETAAARFSVIARPTTPPAKAHISETGSGGDRALALQVAQLSRIEHELAAVTTGTAQATQKILAAAEEIDQLANNLSAALKGKIEQDLAQDITDTVIRIFEACNFQDLIGQRVGKVMTTIKLIESDEIDVAPVPPRNDRAQFLHGPRLDSDNGHVTQDEIDAMFAD
jgi:chemotaxis protein CheZ